MNKIKLLSAAAIFAAPIPVAYSQQITTQIEGRVTDESGNPLSNATVTVTDTRTGATRTINTGSEGNFSAPGLVVGGPYTVTAEAPGFQGQTVQDIITSLQGSTSLSFSLSAAASAEDGATIVVTGQRANLQLRAIGPGTAFGQRVLDDAPTFNRDIRDIIRLDPRVSLDREDTGTGGSGVDRISCLGGNDRQNAFTVDGISQGDVYGLNDTGFSSRSSTPLPYDAVRETQVQFAPFDVEYGNFTGCAINVVTRSGSNEFHGGGFFEFTNADLRGTRVAGRPIGPIEDDIRYGAYLGGPIIRDKLFFFGAYEHHQAGEAVEVGPVGGGFTTEQTGITIAQFNQISEILSRVYGVETGELPRTRPFTNDRYFGRLDWQIFDDHRLELTYQRLEEGTTRSDDVFTGNNPQAVGLNTFFISGTISNYYSGRLFSQWNDRFSTEVRYSRSDIRDRQDPIGGFEAQGANPTPRFIVGIDNPTGPDGAVLAGPGINRSANDLQTTVHQFRAVANLAAGDHRFKAGIELNRAEIFNLFVANATGTLVFRNAADLEAGLLSPGNTNTTSTTASNVVPGNTVGAFGNFTPTADVNTAAADFQRSIYSIYVQDEWEVSDRLNVVLGLRTDWFDGGHPTLNPLFQSRYGIPNTTGFSDLDPVFLPRLGFTYDFDNLGFFGRSQLRGGAGIFSGGDPVVWFGNAFQNNGQAFGAGTSRTAPCPTAAGQRDVVVNGVFLGFPPCVVQAGGNEAIRGEGDTQSIDPDLQMPTVIRANLGFQTELDFIQGGFFGGWRLNLDYIYSQFENPLTVVDLAQAVNPALGLNGFTVDGRPIYRAIDPIRAGCTARLVDVTPTPVYTGITPACFTTDFLQDNELMLTNSDGYRSHIASFILSKNFGRGIFTPGGSVFVNIGYAYTDAQDRRNMYNSTATSNYGLTAAFDRQNPAPSRGFFESRHNVSFSTTFREKFFGDFDTRLGISFIARSGRPYSLTYTGSGAFNDADTGADNALIYVPTGVGDPNISPSSTPAAVASLVEFVNGLACARGYAGRTIARNSCTGDWYFDLDLSFSQELPGPGRWLGVAEDTIRLYATFDNFLNLLDENWNVQRRRDFAGRQDVAGLSGTTPVDAQGRYVITSFTGGTFDTDNQINPSTSVWRVKVGLSYRF